MAKLNLRLPKSRFMIANPFKRIAAFLIDLFLMQMLVISAFGTYFQNIVPKDMEFEAIYAFLVSSPDILTNIYYSFIAIGALMLLYFAYMEYKYSQTIGMMIFKLYAEPTETESLSFFQCVLRNIYLIPIFPIFPMLWVIDIFYFLFKGERLSEKFSKTKTTEEVYSNETFF